MVKYIWLNPLDYAKLAPIFAEEGGDLPDPQLSAIRAAIDTDTDEIVGFATLQYVPHLEPFWIKSTHRGKVSWREFQRDFEEIMVPGGNYYIFPSDERVAKLCKRGGMEEIEHRAWRREVPEKIEG